jgi:2'-5' RNA ligase
MLLKYEAVSEIDVAKLSLMRSQLLPGGAVYSRLAAFDLLGK